MVSVEILVFALEHRPETLVAGCLARQALGLLSLKGCYVASYIFVSTMWQHQHETVKSCG